MTAATYTTNLADIFTDGTTTGWSAIGGGQAGLNQEVDYYIQGTSCLSKNAFASTTKGMIYNYGSDAGGGGTDGAYLMWVTHLTPNSLATKSAGGISFLVGSTSTAYEHYYIGGSDTIEFGGWILAAVNHATAGDTTTGSPSATSESQFGALWYLPTGGPTKGAPAGIDAMRFGRCDAIIQFGTGADPEADFAGIVSNLDSVTNRYGLLSFINGAYFNSGLIQFGSATNAVEFSDSNKTIFLRDHDHVTANFHTWEVQNASSIITFENLVVSALGATSRGRWITTDNATMTWTGCSFTDMGAFSFLTNATIDGCTFRRCDVVTHGGADMSNSSVEDTNVAANSSALIYDIAADPDGEMDGMNFAMGTTLTHAIEFGTNVPATMTLRDCVFSGYGTGTDTNNSTFHFKDTAGTITLNIIGGSGNVSYRTDGATIVIVQDPVTTKVIAQTVDQTKVENARVYLRASDALGPLPFQVAVTITQSAGTATVTHTSHGFSTNQYMVINGADQEEYNRVAQITVTGVNTYTYLVDSGATSPATGSPVCTGVIVYGLTDVNGEVSDSRTLSSDQNVSGWTRKSTTTPFYKTAPLGGTVSSTNGANFTAIMILDE